jgi:hypothetical protein
MRIYRVTFTRTMTVTIAAESEADLERALDVTDPDDWEMPQWERHVEDLIARSVVPADPQAEPKPVVATPDLGVAHDEIVAFDDLDDPDATMKQIEETLQAHRWSEWIKARQGTLPGIE